MFRILVVDDEKIVVSGIKKLLKLHQFPLEVLEAYDGEAAKQILQTKHIDILMTDIELPFIDGLQLIELAKESHPQIKTIVFSAYSNFEYARKAISLNAIYYLLKPINAQEFCSVMSTVIARCQAENPAVEEELASEPCDDVLAFRDAFQNAMVDSQIISAIPLFRNGSEDTRFCLCFVKFSKPILKEESAEKRLHDLLGRATQAACSIFGIDPFRCVLAFRYLRSQDFQGYDLYLKLTAWLEEGEDLCNLFAICAENIENPGYICKELESIKRLEEMNFYFRSENVFLRTKSDNRSFSPSLDTTVFLDAIDRDIAGRNFISLKTNIEKLIEILETTRHLSPIYVKYIFFDIIKKMQTAIPEIPAAEMTRTLECISVLSKMEDISCCLDPLFEKLYELSEAQYSHNEKIVEILVDYIHHHYEQDISLDQLSEMVSLSPAYTSTIFKQVTGQTIINYINEYRMEKAKQLLSETNMKLVNIYPLVGYSSQTYFCTLFKSMFGETPSQYRKKKKG